MLRRIVVVALMASAMFGFSRTARAEAKEIKLGTLAPKDSAWGKVFGAWSKAVSEESGGAVKLTWFYNGSKGDEIAMVGKMRSKELDGAAITATGLSQIWPHVGALQMPGLFPNWAKLDAVREKLSPKFDKEFAQQGFVILGKGDVGMAHLMSRGTAIRTPDDLKKAHPFYIAGDPIGQKFLETVGVPSPKALTVPAILPAVSSRSEGSIDVINSPSIAAEQLGWAPHMTHINDLPSGIGIGALVMYKETYDGLPADAKAVLERTGKNTGRLLTDRIRAIDTQAFNRLKGSKTVVDLNDTEKAAWAAVFGKVRNALKAEGKIRADVFDEVVAAAK
ncbi:MAG: TRAP transporter substrate-binding protein DctP [Labilithrix sp.]|nr:TRAP transporter substrate-binding protein DctP [Labilithrix sp.]MBX3218628.1 TRAP transporter substrate-binding protein DctP [Labilithrix sp.]